MPGKGKTMREDLEVAKAGVVCTRTSAIHFN